MFEKDISQLAKPQIKGRGFIGSGQEIIETQTYYTKPESDWEFDEDQILTYNNPVFKDQCKLRGKDFDKLNTGWVPQRKLDEIDEEEEEEEIEEEEDDDFDDDLDDNPFDDDDDDDLVPPSRRPDRSKRGDPIKSDDVFKFDSKKDRPENPKEDSKENSKKDSDGKTSEEAFGVSDEDLDALFGSSSDSSSEESTSSDSESAINTKTPNRDKVMNALDTISGTQPRPKIKLNIDKTALDKIPQNKPKIKLKSKPKQ